MKKFGKISLSTIAGFMAGMSSMSALALSVEPTLPTEYSQVGTILGVIRYIGIIVAVAMVMYVGIKYLTSGAGKKAEAKETMVPVLIGAALLALAPSVVIWILQAMGMQGV